MALIPGTMISDHRTNHPPLFICSRPRQNQLQQLYYYNDTVYTRYGRLLDLSSLLFASFLQRLFISTLCFKKNCTLFIFAITLLILGRFG